MVDVTWLNVCKDHSVALLRMDVGNAVEQGARMEGGRRVKG